MPDGSTDTVRRITGLLLTYDYVDGVFVDDRYGSIPGTLPMGAIGLTGSSSVPRPAIAVAFKVFYLNLGDLQTAVQISDTTLQEGQGMHGGFGRDSSYNNITAICPDFKKGFVDPAPVSNADIVPTLARVMGIKLQPQGSLSGRVMDQALTAGPDATVVKPKQLASPPASGVQTVLHFQGLQVSAIWTPRVSFRQTAQISKRRARSRTSAASAQALPSPCP